MNIEKTNIQTKFVCENCGRNHDGSYGSGSSFHIDKDYEMNGVSIKDAIVWHSSRERPLDKLLDEFLDAFRSRNAHYTSFDFTDGCGSCTLKTNVPYYDTDDELKMRCVLAGTWVDIETA